MAALVLVACTGGAGEREHNPAPATPAQRSDAGEMRNPELPQWRPRVEVGVLRRLQPTPTAERPGGDGDAPAPDPLDGRRLDGPADPTPAPPGCCAGPVPTATPEPRARRTARYAPEELRPILAQYSWNVDDALLVVYGPTPACPYGESNGKPTVVSDGGHVGIFQLSPIHAWRFEARGWTWLDSFVAERNIAVAFDLYSERGWEPWSCRP